jgi:hypothetical protein
MNSLRTTNNKRKRKLNEEMTEDLRPNAKTSLDCAALERQKESQARWI